MPGGHGKGRGDSATPPWQRNKGPGGKGGGRGPRRRSHSKDKGPFVWCATAGCCEWVYADRVTKDKVVHCQKCGAPWKSSLAASKGAAAGGAAGGAAAGGEGGAKDAQAAVPASVRELWQELKGQEQHAAAVAAMEAKYPGLGFQPEPSRQRLNKANRRVDTLLRKKETCIAEHTAAVAEV